MTRPRQYQTNAERQAAYRQRKRADAKVAPIRSVKRVITDAEPLLQHLAALRKEITRRRTEMKIRREKANWNVEGTIKLELIRMLDYIEEELDKTPIDSRGRLVS